MKKNKLTIGLKEIRRKRNNNAYMASSLIRASEYKEAKKYANRERALMEGEIKILLKIRGNSGI